MMQSHTIMRVAEKNNKIGTRICEEFSKQKLPSRCKFGRDHGLLGAWLTSRRIEQNHKIVLHTSHVRKFNYEREIDIFDVTFCL